MKVLAYRKCSTCIKALKWLDEHNISYEEHAIKEIGRASCRERV